MDGNFALGGQLDVRITPSDVGLRVSVRRVLEITGGRPVLGDVIGDLISWEDGTLVIARRSGETVRVCEESLVAGKTVPRTPPRRRGASTSTPAELQVVAARGWPAWESEQLGEWTLRAAGGFTRRANSVLATGGPAVPLHEALSLVTAWYAERGQRPCVQLTTGSDLDAELERRGWTAEAETRVLTAPLLPLTALRDDGSAVRLTRRLTEGWLTRYRRTGADAARVLAAGPSVWFAEAHHTGGAEPDPGQAPDAGGHPVAIGRCVVDGRWAGFAAVEVAHEHRRRGLATAVLGALADQAAREGADLAYLQVEADNTAANALYLKLGFTPHHTYHYRCLAPGTVG
ncbi:acetyltransferase [Wenjunlia vitaminophila]|uniref:Acetyltransferase n=1 Tax=Wenjunlia vitaminophila TaxID=76728 RepID=A0A0T6LM26_WENVI|nr:GNAT family N-acetyltransferase [Wenjunlia vitaminophila]KRV47064.1 acetyltransferase [Wenjunlia vitaminophila]